MQKMLLACITMFLLIGCKRDNPKHYVREMVGTYTGTWTFTRNTGTTTEPGIIEVNHGSTKKTVYVGPEMAEFELNENLSPVMSGPTLRLSFPEGSTHVIKFERLWEGGYVDEFYGTKQNDN